METLMKADIFFFVTTVAVVIVTILAIVALIYVIKTLRNVKNISDTVKNESELIAEDVHDIRARVRGSGFTFIGIFNLFRDLFAGFAGRSRR